MPYSNVIEKHITHIQVCQHGELQVPAAELMMIFAFNL
jgi:hypothetical protein